MNITLTADSESEGMRADKFLTECDELSDFSRSRIQKIITESGVRVKNQPINKSYRLKAGDEIEIEIPELVEPEILPQDIPLDILFEDDYVIVINKPKGMVAHPAAGHFEGTLVNGLMYHCKGSLSGINGVMRPGIVHRIDKDTSGVIVAAKNDMAHVKLSAQLAAHSMKRIYDALVFGKLKQQSGTVDKNIGRSEKDRKKMAVMQSGGRRAVTHYELEKEFDGFCHVKLKLETGRTHQIRVHMASINHPVLGDTVYGNANSNRLFKRLDGQALHASILGFIHPKTDKYMEFSSNLPEYFVNIIS